MAEISHNVDNVSEVLKCHWKMKTIWGVKNWKIKILNKSVFETKYIREALRRCRIVTHKHVYALKMHCNG